MIKTTIKRIKEPRIVQEKQTWLEFVISMNNGLTEGEKKEMLDAEGSLTEAQIDRLVESMMP
jgi:hypothetical protein